MLSQFQSQCWVNLTLNVESISISMLSQFDSQCWVNFNLNAESIWLSMLSQLDSQCWINLTLNVESVWLSILSQFDSQCWIKLTLNVESIWFKYSPVTHFAWSYFSSASDSTNFLCQNDLIFFSLCIIACRYNYSEMDVATPQSIKISALVCRYQILEYFL